MDRAQAEMTDAGRSPVWATIGRSLSGFRRISVRVRVAIIAILCLLVLGIAFDLGTASPQVCSSCHEMDPWAASWSESAHSAIACVACHQKPTEWYELPQRVIARGGLLWRDVSAHRSGAFDAENGSAIVGRAPMTDEICLQCHDPNRKATSGFRILIDHAEHAKRNGSCVSCHVRTVHPIETRGTAMSLMSQCFTCHGTSEKPEASTECGVCHPAGYELFPASHRETTWERGHGDASESDPNQCGMCHARTFCDDCHGLEMPHPATWAKGPDGHAAAVGIDRDLCGRCHGASPDLCTMCHHTSYDPNQGTWIGQHDLEVKSEGSEYCRKCHSKPYCSFCHTSLVVGSASR